MELREIYESNLRLEERKERPGVLGIVEGVFFVSEVPSRNNRVYPRQLWERVLGSPDVQRLLGNRLMLGTVGHEDIDFDALVREQKVSHVVTKLWMEEDGKGYGRAEILDTPVGRILYTLLKNGSKLAVSSKGWGEYKGTNADGLYVVDESSYILERFDFVVDPGFIEAIPGLRKQYESIIQQKDTNNDKEGKKMEIVEVLMKEKTVLQERLNEILNKIKELEEERDRLLREKAELKKSLEEVKMKGLGEFESICEKWLGVKGRDALKEIELIGKIVEEEAEKLVQAGVKKELLEGESLSEVLLKVLMESEKVSRDNSREMIEESRRRWMKAYFESEKKCKRLEDLLIEARRKLAIVESLGGLDKIISALKVSDRFIRRLIEKRMNEEAERLSGEYGISKDEAKDMILKSGLKKAEESLKIARRTKVEESVERVKDVSGSSASGVSKIMRLGLAERLAEKFQDIGK